LKSALVGFNDNNIVVCRAALVFLVTQRHGYFLFVQQQTHLRITDVYRTEIAAYARARIPAGKYGQRGSNVRRDNPIFYQVSYGFFGRAHFFGGFSQSQIIPVKTGRIAVVLHNVAPWVKI
jgi:hypothetical protein